MSSSSSDVGHDELSQAALDLLPVAVFVAAVPSGEIIRVNRHAIDLCGGTEPVTGCLWQYLRADGADDTTTTQDPLCIALQLGEPRSDVSAVVEVSGRQIPVSVSIEPVRAPDGAAIATVSTCHRIASWKEDAAAVRRSEQRLALALSAGRLGTWQFDLETRLLTSSPQCKANHGLTPDDDLQLERDVLPAIEPEFRERFRTALEQAIESGGSFEIEVPHRWPDGSRHWLSIAGRVIDPSCMVGVSLDVTERRHIEHALRDSERRYRAIVETANEGIWMLDEHARIMFVNRRMTDLTGYSSEEMLGRHKWDFMFDEDTAAMKRLFERRRAGIAEEVMDIRFRHRDGREVWTLMSATPMHEDTGRFIGALDLFTDITRRRRAEQALIAADRSKDEFLAVVAHELRNPIAPILTAVKLLDVKGPSDPAIQKLRDTILRQTMQLSKLVDDLLDIGRVINGKLRLEREVTDLRSILTQAIETSLPVVEQRRHTLDVVLPDSPIYVDVDAARIVQVVSNLLHNAAKYMQEGGRIDLRVVERDGTAIISVRDEGVGLPSEMLERIFHRFVQVESSTHRAHGGLGIGLALVKAIVDLHGGRVEARSAGIGQGSEFRVSLTSTLVPHG